MIGQRQRRLKVHWSRVGLADGRLIGLLALLGLLGALTVLYFWRGRGPGSMPNSRVHTYTVRGTIQKLEPEQKAIVIAHEAIPAYMDAMTMPFKLRSAEEMKGLQAGDRISFRLSITDTESWIEGITRLGTGELIHPVKPPESSVKDTSAQPRHPLLDYPFTNELGQAVTLHSFEGQALAMTFFFTRCPIPDFCPRLSKNFAEASHQLSAMAQAPTNWHFLSVSFDPAFDTPAVLRAYAEKYQYDPAHWSFLTGPKDKIAELAKLSNVDYQPDSGLFNHNFRTMIIDASGRLQMVFPIGGDLSDEIVSEVLKASVTGKHKPS
jgi:protein SCO1/2